MIFREVSDRIHKQEKMYLIGFPCMRMNIALAERKLKPFPYKIWQKRALYYYLLLSDEVPTNLIVPSKNEIKMISTLYLMICNSMRGCLRGCMKSLVFTRKARPV